MLNAHLTEITKQKFINGTLSNKVHLRETMLSTVSDLFPKYVLTLTGPNYDRCMKELIERNLVGIKNTRVVVVEKDIEIFFRIYTQAVRCHHYNKGVVQLLNCDLNDVNFYDSTLQDIDLMCTWINAFELLKTRVTKALEIQDGVHKKARRSRYIMFTLSERKLTLQESYQYFEDFVKLFGAELWGFGNTECGFGNGVDLGSCHNGPRSYIKELTPYSTENGWGRIQSIQVYRYKDSQAMFTCMIEFK